MAESDGFSSFLSNIGDLYKSWKEPYGGKKPEGTDSVLAPPDGSMPPMPQPTGGMSPNLQSLTPTSQPEAGGLNMPQMPSGGSSFSGMPSPQAQAPESGWQRVAAAFGHVFAPQEGDTWSTKYSQAPADVMARDKVGLWKQLTPEQKMATAFPKAEPSEYDLYKKDPKLFSAYKGAGKTPELPQVQTPIGMMPADKAHSLGYLKPPPGSDPNVSTASSIIEYLNSDDPAITPEVRTQLEGSLASLAPTDPHIAKVWEDYQKSQKPDKNTTYQDVGTTPAGQTVSYNPTDGRRYVEGKDGKLAPYSGKVEPKAPAIKINTGGKSDQPRIDKSYQYNNSELNKIAKPIEDASTRLGRLQQTLAEGSPQADALVAPELLTVMAGGAGSGLRMNEAEIARIVGGRSKWESLKADINKWSLDPKKANSITPEQRSQIRSLVDAVGKKLEKKRAFIEDAQQNLSGSEDVMAHRKIVAETRKKILDVDTGGGGSSGTQKIGRFNVEVH